MIWILRMPWVETLGGVLLHFIWQGALIAIALQVALWILRGRPPAIRYLACCAARVAMVAVPPALRLVLLVVPET